ncbi:hypothetical protein [Qipengyuania sp. RANM35]|uniref:hypothetical protein n=1 Tax=Qipengyuania sp. RANM35 TaxID=3068635 RepID=UPI0034DB5213
MVIESKALVTIAWVWFAVWTSFVMWRWWLMMRTATGEADETFDKEGKFKLSKEYWTTESATSAAKRRRKD